MGPQFYLYYPVLLGCCGSPTRHGYRRTRFGPFADKLEHYLPDKKGPRGGGTLYPTRVYRPLGPQYVNRPDNGLTGTEYSLYVGTKRKRLEMDTTFLSGNLLILPFRLFNALYYSNYPMKALSFLYFNRAV